MVGYDIPEEDVVRLVEMTKELGLDENDLYSMVDDYAYEVGYILGYDMKEAISFLTMEMGFSCDYIVEHLEDQKVLKDDEE